MSKNWGIEGMKNLFIILLFLKKFFQALNKVNLTLFDCLLDECLWMSGQPTAGILPVHVLLKGFGFLEGLKMEDIVCVHRILGLVVWRAGF